MKKRLVLFSLLFGIFLLSFISAVSTTVNVHTAPNFTVNAFFTDPNSDAYSTIKRMDINSSSSGLAVFTFDTTKTEFEVKLNLRKDGETHYSVLYDEIFQTGGVIELDFYPKWSPEPVVVNETADIPENGTLDALENTTLINETSSKKGILTALSISDGTLFKNKNFFYYVAGIIILAALFIFFFKYRKYRKENPREYKSVKVVKLSELKNPPQQYSAGDIKNQEDKIEQAKKMIQEAEDELKRLKNPNVDKIEQAKRKLIEDEKELMRLRRESKND